MLIKSEHIFMCVEMYASLHLNIHLQCRLYFIVSLQKILLLPTAIAADSSNVVTNTRCCRYSCMRS